MRVPASACLKPWWKVVRRFRSLVTSCDLTFLYHSGVEYTGVDMVPSLSSVLRAEGTERCCVVEEAPATISSGEAAHRNRKVLLHQSHCACKPLRWRDTVLISLLQSESSKLEPLPWMSAEISKVLACLCYLVHVKPSETQNHTRCPIQYRIYKSVVHLVQLERRTIRRT